MNFPFQNLPSGRPTQASCSSCDRTNCSGGNGSHACDWSHCCGWPNCCTRPECGAWPWQDKARWIRHFDVEDDPWIEHATNEEHPASTAAFPTHGTYAKETAWNETLATQQLESLTSDVWVNFPLLPASLFVAEVPIFSVQRGSVKVA